MKTFNHFDHIGVDGMALCKFLYGAGFGHFDRTSFDMTSIAGRVLRDAEHSQSRVYLIGTTARLIGNAVENINNAFPNLQIVGFRHGYFATEFERNDTIRNIAQLDPDLVICGMGTPLQEQFLLDLRDAGWRKTGFTCGGFLHQSAADVNYYPSWADKYHLRWVYRIYDEPKLIKRYFVLYPWFVLVFITDVIKGKMNGTLNAGSSSGKS